MLFPEKMLRVKIEIEHDYSNTVLETIGNIGALHIDRSKTILSNEAEASRVKMLLALVQKYMIQIEVKPQRRGSSSVSDIEHLLDQTEESLIMIGTKVDDISLQLKEAKEERERFEKAVTVEVALGTVIDTDRLSRDLKMIRMRLGIVTMEAAELLRLALKQKKLLLLDRPLFDKTSAIAVFYEEEDNTDVSRAFVTLKVNEISLDYFSQQAFDLQKKKEEQITLDKQTIAERYSQQLQSIESQLHTLHALEKAKTISNTYSVNTFIVGLPFGKDFDDTIFDEIITDFKSFKELFYYYN